MSTAQPTAIRARSAFGAGLRPVLLAHTESRPLVQLIFMLRFSTGVLLAGGAGGVLRIMAGALSWHLATVSAYVYNGVCDVDGDRVNGSPRPIARGLLAVGTARRLVAAYGGAALVLAAFDGPVCTLATAGMLLLGWLYSARGIAWKNTTRGAGTCVFLMGLLAYTDGCFCVADGHVSWPLVIVAVSMSLWMGLVGAVVKDFGDLAGDLADGRRTMYARGSGRSARRAGAVGATAVGAGFLAAALALAPEVWPAAALACAGGVVVALYCLVPGLTRWTAGRLPHLDPRTLRRLPYRVFMVTQYAVHLCLLLVVWVPATVIEAG
ncbi:UbiA family prenyltransferase [Streptomyces sp. MST-110588]|uniref:UbiA family prenyltransferase n=1 Tax=Streptomyces sp. MST-110588 TaxID=2833628 RepID=UPI001F5DB465|nr:UbiA family prenyltransferase [Streptomyces sp. MST-110588]UNO40793.1 UbiA family prenyltransferase [Streptomyces sp. MST-110588]